MVKTYFIVDKYENQFPWQFTATLKPKFIHVQHCRCIYKDSLVGDVQLHASFVLRDAYLNGFVCYTNTILTKYKKYEYTSSISNFNVWFTDMDGKPIDVQNFTLEMMLEY